MLRILAIFDGSNFYHGSKRISPKTHLTNFGYTKLAELVAGSKKVEVIYCVGEIKWKKDSKTQNLYAQQQKLFNNLQRNKVEIMKGFMLKSGGEYHEKGVDVRIAVEILRGALKNEYDICYLFSSDTDIIPAILEARKEKKKIIYVGFEGKVSRAMTKNCSRTRLISSQMIVGCSH